MSVSLVKSAEMPSVDAWLKEAKAELASVVEQLAAGTYMDAIRVSEAKWEMANIL